MNMLMTSIILLVLKIQNLDNPATRPSISDSRKGNHGKVVQTQIHKYSNHLQWMWLQFETTTRQYCKRKAKTEKEVVTGKKSKLKKNSSLQSKRKVAAAITYFTVIFIEI